MARKPIGKKAMTGAERQRRRRAKLLKVNLAPGKKGRAEASTAGSGGEKEAMSTAVGKAAKDAAGKYTLKEATEMWREAKELSTDPNLPPERREFYRQQAEEFHAEMKKLGHKH
jgi:hypothetical protein